MSEAAGKKPTQVVTGVGRLFYVNAFTSRPNDQGIEKFSVQGLFRKNEPATMDPIRAAVAAAKLAFKTKFPMHLKKNGELPDGFRIPVRDGDAELASELKNDVDYKGCYFINASSKNKPGIVDSEGQEIVSQSEVYSGMFGRLILNFYPYAVKGNFGVAAGFNGLQKVRDGEPKSGVGSVSDVFGRFEQTEARDDPNGPGF